MKLRDIIKSSNAMTALLQVQMPIKVAKKVADVARELDEHVEVYREQQKLLFDKWGEPSTDKDHPKGSTQIKDEHVAEYNEITKQDGEAEFDIKAPPIKISDFRDVDIVPAILFELDWLIKE